MLPILRNSIKTGAMLYTTLVIGPVASIILGSKIAVWISPTMGYTFIMAVMTAAIWIAWFIAPEKLGFTFLAVPKILKRPILTASVCMTMVLFLAAAYDLLFS